MEKVVIFGGTFNPIHLGHVEIINNLLKLDDFDRIIVIPTALPPHKISSDLACDADRFEMCKLATEGMEKVEVSDLELVRGGKSYTYDTLRYFKKSQPEIELSLVCGGDMIVTFKEWHRFEDILKMSEVIAVKRVGIDNESFKEAVVDLVNLGGVVEILKGEICDISSTEIKKHLNDKEYLTRFLPEKVYEYIVNNNLYSGE